LYLASKAKLELDLEICQNDIEFKWSGFCDCLHHFVENTLNNLMGLRNLQAEELEPMFKTAKEFLLKDWKEAENEKPYRQALDLMPKMLFKVISRERLMVTMLDKYDFLQFKSDLQTWLINGTMQWFIHGNFTKEQALSIVDASQNTLSLKQVSVD